MGGTCIMHGTDEKLVQYFGSKTGRDYSEDLGIDGRIISECVLRKWGGKVWTEFICFGKGPVAGSCEHGNEPSSSIKGGEFLDHPSDY
jgi:hypothetical protein